MKKPKSKISLLPRFLLAFIMILWLANSPGLKAQSQPIRILFIGNSFTNNHGLTGMVCDLAKAAGIKVEANFVYGYGKSVNFFIKSQKCWEVIKSKPWDVVVIQDNQRYYYGKVGQLDSFGHKTQLLANNIRFQDRIKKLLPCVQIVYFAGWEVDGGIPKRFPGDNSAKMIDRILLNYKYLNNQPGVNNVIAPIGVAWKICIRRAPNLAAKPYNNLCLYDKDGRHPGWVGSYLSACVLFATIFHRSPIHLKDSSVFAKSPLDSIIKKMAWQAVLDSFDYTNMASVSPGVKKAANMLGTSAAYASYQWYHDSTAIAGANSNIFVPTDLSIDYWVEVKDKQGCTHRSFPFKPMIVGAAKKE